MRSIILAALVLAAAPASAEPVTPTRYVTFVNDETSPVQWMYVFAEGTQPWLEDVLGAEVIEPGKSMRLNAWEGPDRCRYIYEAHFRDERPRAEGVVNACAADPVVHLKSGDKRY